MSNTAGPIYEVTLSVDREIVDAFDDWLANHVQEMLDVPGFLKAESFEIEDDDEGRARRVTHYYLASDEDLEDYLAGPATAMRESGVALFSDRFEASRRVLRRAGESTEGIRSLPTCLNCGTSLGGQYCGNCGQRARSRLISLWELIREAFGDLFELDSRLWQTLVPLLIRPGKLTRDYLLGRRARFMPPFRSYLVLSVVFFLLAFFDPREEFNVLFEPVAESTEEAEQSDQTAGEIRQGVLDDLAEEGIVATGESSADDVEDSDDAAEDSDDAAEDSDDAAEDSDDAAEDSDGGVVEISADTEGLDCDNDDIEAADIPEWLSSRLTPQRLKIICERVVADDGRALFDKLRDNVPAALFFLMPLMALILKMMYPLSKRYYVEHLLFVVHYHAFFFLILTLQILFARFALLVGIPENAIDIVLIGAAIYIPVYLFRSMRRVYGQGFVITALKFVFLGIAYFGGFFLMMSIAALFAAFSI